MTVTTQNNDSVYCVAPDETHHYFFGYYDKSPWHRSGRWMLAGRAAFKDRAPKADDLLELGLIDLEKDYAFKPLATTRAWNWQQGCMLQWLDESHIIFNDCVDDRFAAVIVHINTGERRILPRPIYTICTQRGIASSLNFARLHRLRPGYGYDGVADTTADTTAPENDGLWIMDLHTGDANLIYSIAQARELLPETMRGDGPHWMNHAQFAPSGNRLAVLHRWKPSATHASWQTRMLTINIDSSDPYPLIDAGMCSHYDWRDDEHLVAFARAKRAGELANGFYCFEDQSQNNTPIAPEQLSEDGHCSYSPDRKWILNDTYPDPKDECRTLMLIRTADHAVFEIGRFYSPMPNEVENRCDLHPRWNHDGSQVCIDSIHEGRRAMYIIDVRTLVHTK